MTDSGTPDALDEKREANREQRLRQVKRWAAYVERTPASEWGAELNAVVDSQLQAVRDADVPASIARRVADAGAEYQDERRSDAE